MWLIRKIITWRRASTFALGRRLGLTDKAIEDCLR